MNRAARRPTRRIVGLAAACVGALLTLTACIDINADVTVNPDATGTGTFELVLQKQAAAMLGVTSADQLGSQIAAEGSGGIPGMTDCTASETDAGYVYSCSFANETFTGSDGPWTITKSGETLVFAVRGNAAADATGDAADEPNLLGDTSLGTMTVKVTFPGPISQITGTGVEKTSDTTATISTDLGQSVDVSITAAASSGGLALAPIIVVVVALLVIALIVAVAVVMIRRRKPAAAALPAPGNAAAAQVVAGATATEVVTPAPDTPAPDETTTP